MKTKLKVKEIKEFKKRLEEMRDQLSHTLSDSSKEVRSPEESKGYSQHQADEGTDDFDRNISLNLTSREFDLLTQIERALSKIEEGTFGVCDITQKPIPLPRLEAIPYATTTVEAQEQLERGQV